MKTKFVALVMVILMTSMVYGGYVYSDYDWEPYNGHQYAITRDYSNWTQAEAWAVEVGGHLVTINDAEENAWVAEFIKDSYLDVTPPGTVEPSHNAAWIGLEYKGSGDMSLPDSWKWSSGEPLTFWKPGYPFPLGGVHMYILGMNSHEPEGWGNNAPHEYRGMPRGVIEIPEPATLLLLGMGSLAFLRKRKAV